MNDIYERLFDQVRIKGSVYFMKALHHAWGIEVPQQAQLCRFHMVLAGATWIEVPETGACELLGPRDFAIVPHGRTHVLSDMRGRSVSGRETIPGMDVPGRTSFVASETGGATVLLCGYYRHSDLVPNPLLAQLPELLVCHADAPSGLAAARAISDIAVNELCGDAPASELILNRLMEVLFLIALRRWVDEHAHDNEALLAISDIRLQRTIAAIHDNPEQPWTVETLARIAAQSRTAYAKHFRSAFGVGPIEYLHRIRMDLARRLLGETELRLDDIAQKVGYADTSAFSRAFSRATGSAPLIFRRMLQQ